MEINFVIDLPSVVLGIVLNWVILFTIAIVLATRAALKKKKQSKTSSAINLDTWKM